MVATAIVRTGRIRDPMRSDHRPAAMRPSAPLAEAVEQVAQGNERHDHECWASTPTGRLLPAAWPVRLPAPGVRKAAPLMIRRALVVTVSAMATIDQRASVLTGFDDTRSRFPAPVKSGGESDDLMALT